MWLARERADLHFGQSRPARSDFVCPQSAVKKVFLTPTRGERQWAFSFRSSSSPISSSKIKSSLLLWSISVADGSWKNEWPNLHQLSPR